MPPFAIDPASRTASRPPSTNRLRLKSLVVLAPPESPGGSTGRRTCRFVSPPACWQPIRRSPRSPSGRCHGATWPIDPSWRRGMSGPRVTAAREPANNRYSPGASASQVPPGATGRPSPPIARRSHSSAVIPMPARQHRNSSSDSPAQRSVLGESPGWFALTAAGSAAATQSAPPVARAAAMSW